MILKNGNFIQRRKLYSETPIYNNKHHFQLVFDPDNQQTEQLKRLRLKSSIDKEHIRQQYQYRVQRMMHQKYLSNIGISKTSSNDDKNSQDQDALAKQLEQFNSSRLSQSQNIAQYNTHLYDKSKEDHAQNYIKPNSINDYSRIRKESYQDHNYSKGLQNRYQTIQQSKPNYEYDYRIQQNSYRNPQTHSQNKMKSMQYPNNQLELQKQYKRYAQVTKGIPSPDYPFRNIIPDKLQNFLRQNVKADHRRSIDICVAPNRNKNAVK